MMETALTVVLIVILMGCINRLMDDEDENY
jgi:hypothetical protein